LNFTPGNRFSSRHCASPMIIGLRAQPGIAPPNHLESALIETLAGNSAYTATVRGVNNTTGIAVVEVCALQ